MDSTDDERIENNAVRHGFRILTETEKRQVLAVKDMGLELVELCDMIGSSRELSLAKTKIEEAVMWAVRHITR